MIITCCIVTKSNSIFFKRSLANIYYITSSLRMLILWNKMYQDFCCYSDLKDVTTRRRKRRVPEFTAAPELEFCNGRRSFLASPYHKPVSAVTSRRRRSSLSGKNPSSRFGRISHFWKTQNLNCRCACC